MRIAALRPGAAFCYTEPSMSTPHRTSEGAAHAAGDWRGRLTSVMAGLLLPFAVWCSGCVTEQIRPASGRPSSVVAMEVTGYCNCGECCNWTRGWLGLGQPVVENGPNAGRPKAVGVTASGSRAAHGTIAADTSVVPLGTVVYVPGYGYGRVEDRGGAIRGNRLDLWFPTHEEAQQWGRRRMNVRVWRP